MYKPGRRGRARSGGSADAGDLPESESLCTWEIPTVVEGSNLAVKAEAGRVTAVVGANGSGKSALGFWMQRTPGAANVERLIAHRRLWFEHASPDLTPAGREQLRTNMLSWESTPDSRWRDHAQTGRPAATLYDLLRRQNERNAELADLHDAGRDRVEIEAQIREAPLRQINRVLAQANLEVQLELMTGDSLEAVHARRGARYPITEMSDGEKSAVLLAAEILTRAPGTVQIIDEPERHLHRSISAGLISAALAERPDCHFVLLLVRSFPVRDSGMPGRVASALRFKSVRDFEAAARSLVIRAPDLAQQLRDIIGSIPQPTA